MQNIVAEKPLVSVVIATYNMGQYLAQAVDSILQQTWANLEIVVVDDGSKDNTSDVMDRYKNEPKVIYVKNENQGQPKAKNCGIKRTTGEFIAFCDADDLWEPNKLELQIPLFSHPKIGIVYSEVSHIDENNERYLRAPNEKRYAGKVTDYLLIENFVPFGTAVIRRACVEKNGIFDEQFRMGIDWDLWLRYSLDWDFAYLPEKTYVYRVWSGQMSNNYRGRYEHAFRILNHFIKNYGAQLNARRVSTAIADIYVNQAIAIAQHEKKFIEPLNDIITGLKHDPFYFYGWKSLLKLLLNKH
jgi:glycosyltransferase involved in cell wall biosynthesis